MPLNKLQRFAELNTFQNVLQYPTHIKGNWHTLFQNHNPITLELACGKGEYTLNLAKQNPNKNYIGIDIKGNRIYIGAKKALEENIQNVRFLRIQIEKITDYFAPHEIEEIWITFPDPFLRESKAKNRLTHPKFLRMYQQILQPKHHIHLKTDSDELMQFTLETITQQSIIPIQYISNIYQQGIPPYPLNITTFYEKQHLAQQRIIQYIQFTLPNTPIHIPPKTKQTPEAHE